MQNCKWRVEKYPEREKKKKKNPIIDQSINEKVEIEKAEIENNFYLSTVELSRQLTSRCWTPLPHA